MRKIILCTAALFLGGMAFGQVSGAPDAQVVTPLPGTSGHMNTGQSVQNGDNNAVRVRQAGTENSVYTLQDNGSGFGSNLARIMQTGEVQAAISAFQNAAEALQSGSENQSTTIQEGDLNNAYTAQGQSNDASANNKARIQQGTGQQAEGNYAAIEQDGDDNQASILQTYDNNDAWTRQIGDDNKSMVVQNAGPNGTDGHEAWVEQYGNSNESSVNQSGAGGRNSAHTRQVGDNNKAKQLQTTTALSGTPGNRALANQGDFFISASEAPLTNVVFFRVDAEVSDVTFPSQANPGSMGGIVFQTQFGKMNEAETHQFGTENYAEQYQAGWGNQAMIVQDVYGASSDGSNYAKQEQYGDNNLAGLVQLGDDHKAFQYQEGANNEVLSAQKGDHNLLNTYQFGNDNYATSAQDGSDNRALLVQRGGNSYVSQQMGTGNQIDVLQLGPNGNFNYDAVECSFDDPMDPWMDYTVPGFDLDPICPDC